MPRWTTGTSSILCFGLETASYAQQHAAVHAGFDEGDADSDALQQTYTAACRSLQEVADDNDIVADIECGDDF